MPPKKRGRGRAAKKRASNSASSAVEDDYEPAPKLKKEESFGTKVDRMIKEEQKSSSEGNKVFKPDDTLISLFPSQKVAIHKDFACMLNQTNINSNNNKFYVIQVGEVKKKFVLFTKWGRVGEEGCNAVEEFTDVEGAIKGFKKKFKDKTKNDWEKKDNFTPFTGKYTLIEMMGGVEHLWMSVGDKKAARGIQLLQDGATVREVAKSLRVSLSFVYSFWGGCRGAGDCLKRLGQGRRRSTTPRQDRYLRKLARRNPQLTIRELQSAFHEATNVKISHKTVRNRLREAGMDTRIPSQCPILTPYYSTQRLQFSLEHKNWQFQHWRLVLFTEESRFHLSTCNKRVKIWRSQRERSDDYSINQYDRRSDGSVVVWGAISLEGRTNLYFNERGVLNSKEYRDEILRSIVQPYAGAVGKNFILMHDDGRAPTGRMVTTFLGKEGIEAMECPPMSPDLNPMEHLWDLIYRRVSRLVNPPTTLQGLQEALIQEWKRIPQDDIRELIRSLPRRYKECVYASGELMGY